MSVLISGSLAYDHIMDFPGRFKDHILPEQVHILNVCFTVQQVKRSWGGTGGNISYGIRLLGQPCTLLSAIGSDGESYLEHLNAQGIDTSRIMMDMVLLTAGGYITTDQDDNQITAFCSGPLARVEEISLDDIPEPTVLCVSPNPPSAMQSHIFGAKRRGWKTIFDPGQMIPMFEDDAIRECITSSWCVIGNDYEMKLLTDRTGWSEDVMLEHTDVLITTLGANGSRIRTSEEDVYIPACSVSSCVDPTGAGDAFRAGLCVGIDRGLPLPVCARLGSALASFAVERQGTQAHTCSTQEFAERYQATYNEPCPL